MALFGTNKAKKETKAEAMAPVQAAVVAHDANDVSWVLKNPRITEKATDVSSRNVYVFDVDVRANKAQVARAVMQVYKVTPERVNLTAVKAKTVRNARTGMSGRTNTGKKAYVYLKKGDSISIM